MAHFSYTTDLKHLLRIDDPVTKGPLPRWQRKALDKTGSNNSSMNGSKMSSENISLQLNKTPSSKPRKNVGSNSMGKKTPGGLRSNATTPKQPPNGGDRYIPMRSTTNFELASFLVNKSSGEELGDIAENGTTEGKENHNQLLTETIHGGVDPNQVRVLAYKKKAPAPPDGYLNPMRVIYSQNKTPGTAGKNSTRYIPQACDRVLDAPEIIDDYYLNLIDWGITNVVAVALANCVYLWNAESGAIQELVELEGGDFPCSVSWIQGGAGIQLAIGTSTGFTQIWDCAAMKRLRTMAGHSARVCSLSWNQHILSSGSRSGHIIHHDVRQREHCIATLFGHTEEVCGLRWCTEGRYLASGGNDNLVNIWDGIGNGSGGPLHRMADHNAAVKAVAWCPWRRALLATGGGTADRTIRVWNVATNECLSATDTKSQVCALQWSQHFKELISGHGYSQNQLTIWKYPQMTKVTELTGHSARILQMCTSPDGTTVLSAGADETVRLWKCFTPDPQKKTESSSQQPMSLLRTNFIR